MRFLALAAVSLALCLLVGAAHAQGGDATTADRLFREGRALMKQGSYEEACSKLEESHRLDPAPGTAINLGDCFEKVGKVASALLAYQAARDLLKPGDPRVHPVKQQIAVLEKRVPRLTIKLAPGAPEGTKVTRDGRTVEATKLGVPVVVNPGKSKIVVSAPGRETARFNVTLAEGQSRELLVEPGEASRVLSGSSATAKHEHDAKSTTNDAYPNVAQPGSSQRAWGYGLLGLGGAGLLTGAVFWKLAVDTHDEPCPNGDCRGLNKTEREQRAAGTVAGVVGAAALAGGVSLLLFAPAGHDVNAAVRATPVGESGWAINVGGEWW